MSADIKQLQHQISDLQSQLAFQEDAVKSLDDALAGQQQEILLLKRQMELLRQRQQEFAVHAETGSHSPVADEKPPHY
jgi:SlyX protein